jgi:hypothetical protein
MIVALANSPTQTQSASQSKYRLLPYDVLIKRAIPKQIKEAERLKKMYGQNDPEIARRYLTIATYDTPIKNFEPCPTSIFWQDESPVVLPINWENTVKNAIQDKPAIAVSTIFTIFFGDKELTDLETLDMFDFFVDNLKEWGWIATNNPRLFRNPWIQQLTLDFGDL